MKKKLLVITSLFLATVMAGCAGKSKNSSGEISSDVSSEPASVSNSSVSSSSSSSSAVTMPEEKHELKYEISNGDGTFEKNKSQVYNISKAPTSQEGTILHAWNWSMENIKNNMALIAKAGYTTVQTSPMQPQKDYYDDETVSNWWKLYQPLGFSIATKNNAIGTKDELIEMVKEADKYGIKVIVDVVANHLAGASTNGTKTLNPDVKEYEPDIYGKNGTVSGGALLHSKTTTTASDSSADSVTQGNIGMPDLDTSNSVVQQRVLSLLKEYVDCGVDGFRFDAAKHIETPSDNDSVKSDFWSVVLNGAQEYATSKGEGKLYYYGEILNTAGGGRDYSFYTSMMSVTDNTKSSSIRDAVNSSKASQAVINTYTTGITADKAVLWAESHDTYADRVSSSVSMNKINKAYALCASKNKATSLYLARPNEGSLSSGQVRLGEIGTDFWRSPEITAVNNFHNYFNGSDETISTNNDVVFTLRTKGEITGTVMVNFSNSASVNCDAPAGLADGNYLDQVTGNEVTVSDGKISAEIDDSGIAVLVNYDVEKTEVYDAPVLIAENGSTKYSTDTFSDTYTIKNASKAYLQVDDNDPVEITNGASINISELTLSYTCKVTLTVEGLDGSKIIKVFRYKHYDPDQEFVVYFVNKVKWSNVYIYIWNDASQTPETKWSGTPMTLYGQDADGNDIYTYSIDTTRYDRLIFNDNDGTQTVDLVLDKNVNYYEIASTKDSAGHYNVTTSVMD